MTVYVYIVNFNRDSYLQQFGISVNTQMTDVQGRVLNPPKILYGGWVSCLVYIPRILILAVIFYYTKTSKVCHMVKSWKVC